MPEAQRRVRIRWTQTAKELLKRLPEKVCEGLLNKAGELYTCSDPTKAHKPLTGPLQGYYRITYSRYRAIYSVQEEEVEGQTVINVTIIFIAAGQRQERSKRDVYKVAEKIVQLGLIDLDDESAP